MNKLFIALTLILASCASIPKDFAPYVASFEAHHPVRNTRFEFGTVGATALSSDNLAECIRGSAVTPHRIVVSEKQWNGLSDIQREALIFHELGHCVLGLDHTSGIMQASLISGAKYQANRSTLIEELFHE